MKHDVSEEFVANLAKTLGYEVDEVKIDESKKSTKAKAAVEPEEVEEIEEEVEGHQCPLCQSQLDESVEDEAILDLVENTLSLLSEDFNDYEDEDSEDLSEMSDDEDEDEDDEDEDEDDEDEKPAKKDKAGFGKKLEKSAKKDKTSKPAKGKFPFKANNDE